jgi:HK97 family phage major capsid protein
MTELEVLQKADMTLSGLIGNGGYLLPEQQMRFYRKMIAQPTILQNVRTIQMPRPQLEINKIGFGTRMLQAANQGAVSAVEAGETGSRALTREQRYQPTTDKISLETSEVIAEINLPYEVLEDNIEGGQIDGTEFENTILDMMAERAAADLEELLINGDTTSGDTYLALQNGILKNVVSNIVNQNGAPLDADMFANMMKALPVQYHRLFGQYKHYLENTQEINYRMQVAQRQTSLGDAILQGTAPVSVLGIPMERAAYMPTNNILMTIPKNIIWGVQRQMRMEFDKNIRERVIIIVLTMRVATAIEQEDMVVKAINVG